ncbi:DUF4307 domain-containing protein [Ornithinimicrobium pekingense]|uniref:DUF4307 domain-containing protein n=1 Tax=Ornithinimicrobium pekingense TaxID=384677 RepID=A0ABQ2FCG6_9MICO|nr:DUF4307 domain-containing protein [Ornithinimicrobium pekingense]GGK80992.1 hypothetical protein GCM10011509_31840 [Ornithinimicrobium pekingense]
MTSAPPPEPTPHRASDGAREGRGMERAVDWDAEEEAAEARGGPRRLDDRARRRWWLVGSAAVAVMTALAVWFGIEATSGRVHWVNTGHQVVSGTQVDVRFDLRRDPAREVVCRLEAQEASHAVVGRADVTVGPAQSSPSRHVESVRTAAPAITGYVEECWYADEEPRGR